MVWFLRHGSDNTFIYEFGISGCGRYVRLKVFCNKALTHTSRQSVQSARLLFHEKRNEGYSLQYCYRELYREPGYDWQRAVQDAETIL